MLAWAAASGEASDRDPVCPSWPCLAESRGGSGGGVRAGSDCMLPRICSWSSLVPAGAVLCARALQRAAVRGRGSERAPCPPPGSAARRSVLGGASDCPLGRCALRLGPVVRWPTELSVGKREKGDSNLGPRSFLGCQNSDGAVCQALAGASCRGGGFP